MNEKEVELVVERLTRRVEQTNTYFLKKIAQSIKKISKLKPTEAQKLVQILKYGGEYEEIVKKIQKYTSMNLDDIDKIFSNYAKKDQQFNEKFYRYRNIPFLKYDENVALKRQTEALSNIARNDMFDFTRSNVLGYEIRDLKGNLKFTGLRETYNNVLDEALLNVGQGKETFDSAIGRILNELGESGIRTLNYESGRSVRLDSAVKMHLQSRLRELHNETQQMIGKEIDADGIEITVHEFPAPDHEDVQGRQFSNEEFDKLQAGDFAKGYNGKTYTLDHDNKNGYRPISEMNCYHTIFSIVLGVSKPRYSDDQLKKIKEDNEKGFELDGKHYSMYEGTQIQRRLEREIRSQKDIQIMSREADNKELLAKSQTKINQLTKKYNELNKVSGLKQKRDRLKVSGYRRIKIEDNDTTKSKINAPQSTLVIPNYDFSRFKKAIDESKSLPSLEDDFDYKGFMQEYDKFYNTLDKKELQKVRKEYTSWLKTDMSSSNPMGEYLNKELKYDGLPELIKEKDFWKDEDNNPVDIGDIYSVDKNHWYRGVSATRYSNILKQDVPDRELTKQFVDEFKTGKYYAGIGINGNGTYVSESYSYATKYSKDIEDGMILVMPKESAKIVSVDKINYIKTKLIKYIGNKEDLYTDTAITYLDDNGYLASILGYDIVNVGQHKIILNRASIKVVK